MPETEGPRSDSWNRWRIAAEAFADQVRSPSGGGWPARRHHRVMEQQAERYGVPLEVITAVVA
jgi:hypothetical protein